jgi:hypothetical protein
MKYKKGGSQNLDVRNNAVMAELADLGNKRTEPVQQPRPNTSVDQKTSNKMRKPVK